MEADRTDPPSGKSRVDCVLPDMPPGDPPLQDTAITFRQDCEQRFAKAGLLGVAKGEWPARADAVEQNFRLHLLPPLVIRSSSGGHSKGSVTSTDVCWVEPSTR